MPDDKTDPREANEDPAKDADAAKAPSMAMPSPDIHQAGASARRPPIVAPYSPSKLAATSGSNAAAIR